MSIPQINRCIGAFPVFFSPIEAGLGPIEPGGLDSYCEAAPILFDGNPSMGIPWFCQMPLAVTAADVGGSCELPEPELNSMYARAALDSGDYQGSIYWWDHALSADPLNPEYYWGRGVALANHGWLAQAALDFKTVHDLAPELADPLLQLSLAQLALGEYPQAIEYLGEFVGNFPERPEGKMYLGMALVYSGQYQESLAPLNEAIEANGKDPQAVMSRGVAYANLGKFLEAAMDFQALLTIDPGHELAAEYLRRVVNDWAWSLSLQR